MIRLLVLAVAGLASAGAAEEPPVELVQLCPSDRPQIVAGRHEGELKRLDRLPAAEAYIAVLRRENGCTRPQPVREYQEQALGRR